MLSCTLLTSVIFNEMKSNQNLCPIVCFLFSFRSPHNEQVTKAIVQAIKDSGESWGPECLLRSKIEDYLSDIHVIMIHS